jgi:hypothetical protein
VIPVSRVLSEAGLAAIQILPQRLILKLLILSSMPPSTEGSIAVIFRQEGDCSFDERRVVGENRSEADALVRWDKL